MTAPAQPYSVPTAEEAAAWVEANGLTEHVRALVAAAPPPTDEQIARLAGIFRRAATTRAATERAATTRARTSRSNTTANN